MYESQTVWKQNGKETGDEQTKIVYNIGAFEKAQDPRLKALLRYLSTETVTDEARTLAEKGTAFKRHFPDGRPHMKYELDLYDKWCEGKEEGIKEGRQEGREAGMAEKALSAAKNFLAEGIAPETVARCVGISLEEVKALRENLSR